MKRSTLKRANRINDAIKWIDQCLEAIAQALESGNEVVKITIMPATGAESISWSSDWIQKGSHEDIGINKSICKAVTDRLNERRAELSKELEAI